MKKISTFSNNFLLGALGGFLFALFELTYIIFKSDYTFETPLQLLAFTFPPTILYSIVTGLLVVILGLFLYLPRLKRIGFRSLILTTTVIYLSLSLILWSKKGNFPEFLKVDRVLPPEEEVAEKPNILWIVIDAGRADHFSSYGYNRPTTPNIDSLTKEGVLFKNAIAAAGWTVPSHSSMFTGLYTSAHHADGIERWLDPKFTTIAEILQKEGYHTGAITNTRNVSNDTNLSQGFDTFVTLGYDPDLPNHNKLLLGKLLIKYKDYLKIPPQFLGLTLYGLSDSGAEKTRELVTSFLETKSKVPFFLFVHFWEVHSPYGDTPGAERFLPEIGVSLPEAKKTRNEFEKLFPDHIPQEVTWDWRSINTLIALYDGDLFYTDSKVGEIVKKLRDLGILDNTLLVITTDHGENLGERNTVRHIYDLHRTVTHVPLIIRYPKKFKAGGEVERMVQTVDIFPTVLEIAGIDYQGGYQGYSLLDTARPQFAVAESQYVPPNLSKALDVYNSDKYLIGNWKSLQTPEYDYIESDGAIFLYNLRVDPYEKNNLADSEPELAKKLSLMLKNLIAGYAAYRPTQGNEEQELMDRLERLKNIEY